MEKRMKIIGQSEFDVIDRCMEIFHGGGVVMHPTETCYGLAVDVFNEKALSRIYEIKGRDRDKPVSILIDSLGMAMEYGVFSDKALEVAGKYWPGPLSIVVPRTSKLPRFFNKGHEYISLRYSCHSLSMLMAEKFGSPLTTTSANLAGEQPLYSADISNLGDLSKEIDLVVDGGDISLNKPSTIVKIDGDFVEVLRQGDLLCE